jgi:hypothetical protein
MGAVGTISVRPKTEAVLAKIGSRRPRQPQSITRISLPSLGNRPRSYMGWHTPVL